MKIQVKVNDKLVQIHLDSGPVKDGELARFIVQKIDWEGKEGQVLKVDKELENLLDYIKHAGFTLPPLNIPLEKML